MKVLARIRFLLLTMIVVFAGSCGSADGWYYPYGYGPDVDIDWGWDWDDYFWNPTPFGGYTIIHRPVYEVDGWTSNAFRTRPYTGYYIRRHNSPVIVYTAKRKDRTFEVNLTPMNDSTHVEVRARRGKNGWEPKPARNLMSSILKESK